MNPYDNLYNALIKESARKNLPISQTKRNFDLPNNGLAKASVPSVSSTPKPEIKLPRYKSDMAGYFRDKIVPRIEETSNNALAKIIKNIKK